MTFYVEAAYYPFLKGEYEIAVADLKSEMEEENNKRRLRYREDLVYQESLLNMYHTDEEVNSFFERYKYYDSIELKETVELLQSYMGRRCRKYKTLSPESDCKIRVLLPKESIVSSKYSTKSHCTISGGVYKTYHFAIDEKIIEYLHNAEDITKFASLKDVEWLEDPAFYSGDKLKCSICSHNKTLILLLDEEEYEIFKTMRIEFNPPVCTRN